MSVLEDRLLSPSTRCPREATQLVMRLVELMAKSATRGA